MNRESKLCNYVDIYENNKNCVILKVKGDKKKDIVKLGYFDLDDNMFRLTKGDTHICTVFKDDGSSHSWEWGKGGYTLVSDNLSKKGHLIEACIKEDFDIYIGENIDLINESLFITSLEDVAKRKHKVEFMYWDKDDDICTHKDEEFYKYFKTISDGMEHFHSLGYDLEYQGKYRAETGCYVETYQIEKQKKLDDELEM